MPAAIDSMFSVREVPWHGLGEVLDKHPKSVEDALKKSGLNWDVLQRPVKVTVPVVGEKTKTRTLTLDGREGENEGYFVNLRSDTMEPLGVVTGRYRPVQNVEAFDFLASVFGTELHFETAGALMGGRRVWVMLRLPEFIEVGGDPLGPYAFISNSHDGKSSVTTALTPVRIVCMNTLTAALNRAKGLDAQRTYTLRHLGDMQSKLAEAREVLQVTVNYYEQFKLLGDKLARTKCSDAKVRAYLDRILPTDGLGDRAIENREEAKSLIRQIFKGDGPAGDTTGDSPGTFWTLYNAASEFADHCRPELKAGGRFQRSIDDPDGFKTAAWRAVLDQTGVEKGSKNKTLISI